MDLMNGMISWYEQYEQYEINNIKYEWINIKVYEKQDW